MIKKVVICFDKISGHYIDTYGDGWEYDPYFFANKQKAVAASVNHWKCYLSNDETDPGYKFYELDFERGTIKEV